jgi:hypothetical protein
MNKQQLLSIVMLTALSSTLLADGETTYLHGIEHAFSKDGKDIVASQPFTPWETCKAQVAPAIVPVIFILATGNEILKDIKSEESKNCVITTALFGPLSWFGLRWGLNRTEAAPVSWKVQNAINELRKSFNRTNKDTTNNLIEKQLDGGNEVLLEEATAANLTNTDGSKGYKLVDLKRFFDGVDVPSDKIATNLGELVDRNDQDNDLYKLYTDFVKDRKALGKVENAIQSSDAYKIQWAAFSNEHAHDRAQESHRSKMASANAELRRTQAEAVAKAREVITGRKATVVTDNTHRFGIPRA